MRDEVLAIRLNADELDALKQIADDEMIPVSTLARRIIVRATREETTNE